MGELYPAEPRLRLLDQVHWKWGCEMCRAKPAVGYHISESKFLVCLPCGSAYVAAYRAQWEALNG